METYPEVPMVRYEDCREAIRSGDLLMCSGSGTMSRLIQYATGSVWSHVGFLLRLETPIVQRIMVLESVESIGIRTVPLSQYILHYNHTGKGYPGKVYIARDTRFTTLPPERLSHFSHMAVDLFGAAYNTQMVLAVTARIVAAKLGMTVPLPDVTDSYICSEYAALCYRGVGLDVPYPVGDFVAPRDFATSPHVEFVCELVVAREEV